MFDTRKFLSYFNTGFFTGELIYMSACGSTTDELRRRHALLQLPDWTILLTDHQTTGRGRGNRRWHSAPGVNLTFSILLPVIRPLAEQGLTSLAASAAVAQCLEQEGIPDISLKWPNDVLVNRTKCAGILLEQCRQGEHNNIIAGIGLNVNEDQNELPDYLRNQSTSLKIATGNQWDREHILAGVIVQLHRLATAPAEVILSEWKLFCGHLNEAVNFHSGNQMIRGIFQDLTPEGFAVILTDDERRMYSQGEIRN